ncbi:uncharacterized protein BKA78DRAFT_29002 [Phyllosticta capitalensis]|uniref:uncharacterized protein n=1 Tax=Phyllosticta capitalensis TaxID=121624 RepID=UPI00313015CE
MNKPSESSFSSTRIGSIFDELVGSLTAEGVVLDSQSNSSCPEFTKTSVAAVANNLIQSHNHCRLVLANLDVVTRALHKSLVELIDSSTRATMTIKRLPTSLCLDDIVPNEEEMPLELYTMDRLLYDNAGAAYRCVGAFAIQEAIRSVQGLRSPVGKSVYDISSTLQMMRQPFEFQDLDTSDFHLYDEDHSIRDSLERGANCIERLLRELESIKQHQQDILGPFLAMPQRNLTATELAQWNIAPQDTAAIRQRLEVFWTTVKSTGDQKHEDFDEEKHKEALKKFITYFSLKHVEHVARINIHLERYRNKLAAWRDGLPEQVRLERVE